MDIRFGIPEAQAICSVVVGNTNFTIVEAPTPATISYFIWNGTSWALVSTTPASRIDVMFCYS